MAQGPCAARRFSRSIVGRVSVPTQAIRPAIAPAKGTVGYLFSVVLSQVNKPYLEHGPGGGRESNLILGPGDNMLRIGTVGRDGRTGGSTHIGRKGLARTKPTAHREDQCITLPLFERKILR